MTLSRRVVVSGLSYVVISVVGFLGTLYFARTLGAAALGIFALGMSLIQWLRLADLGVTRSAIKRISEGRDDQEFFTASFLVQSAIGGVMVLPVIVFRDSVNDYIGGEYAVLVVGIFLLNYVANGFVLQSLKGYQQAHVADALDAVERLLRVIVQIGLVFVGFGVFGMFFGVVVSLALTTIIGLVYLFYRLEVEFSRPAWQHLSSLYDYAKYSVVGSLKGHAYSWIDITVLGFFVTQSIIGVYQVSWTLAMFFGIFGRALRNNLFPEVSNVSASGERQRVKDLFGESLIYVSIFPIPGIVGALVVGGPVLGIYGQEFTDGKWVLVALSVVSLLRAYEEQILAFLDGMNMPKVTFKINAIFILVNIVFNIALISQFGAIGAAVATVAAIAISLGLGWWSIASELNVAFPVFETGKQIFAAAMMGAVVVSVRQIIDVQPIWILLPVILLGAGVYFVVLTTTSHTIRTKLRGMISGALS